MPDRWLFGVFPSAVFQAGAFPETAFPSGFVAPTNDGSAFAVSRTARPRATGIATAYARKGTS